MRETLFVFDKRNYLDCQNGYRGARNYEYYLGEYSIEPGSVIDVRADKKLVGTCSIIRVRSRSRQFFKRSWSHIREDATDVAVLWFVKRGRLCITHRQGG
jgi:AraC family transcriptional activator of tynA and feaB